MSTGVDFDSVGAKPQPTQTPGVDFDTVNQAPHATPHAGVDFDSVKSPALGDNHKLTYQNVKDLWVKHGGDPSVADTMAHVAIGESGDLHSFANVNPNRDHHTSYAEGGKTYYPEGLFQISTVHGYKGDMYDPDTNVKYAVQLYNAQGLKPWEASKHYWGQFLEPHSHPDKPLAKLPAGGFAQVIGAKQIPGTNPRPGTQAQESWWQQVADRMESAVKAISQPLGPHGPADVAAEKSKRQSFLGPNLMATGPGIKLSQTLQHVGEAADVPTFDFGNALARRLGGDRTALGKYWSDLGGRSGSEIHDIVTSPKKAAGAVGEGISAVTHPFDTAETIAKQLDVLGQNWGPNTPSDIAYWSAQPGVKARVLQAKDLSPQGYAVQLALGMHADLARLKPGHPYLTGAETTGMEFLNPSYYAAGFGGSMLSRASMESLEAARAGTYGVGAQKLAHLLSKSPMLGNRFTKMGDAFGVPGETWHYQNVRDIHNAPYESQAHFTSDDTFGGATQEQQIKIVHELQNPGQTYAHDLIGDTSYADRAQNIRQLIAARDAELAQLDPEMAKTLLQDGYFSQQGAWVPRGSQATDPRFPQGTPSVARAGGPGSPIAHGRIYDNLAQGQAEGAQLKPDWVPSGAASQHDAVLNRYVTLARYVKSLEQLPTKSGTMGLFDIDYTLPQSNGSLLKLGTGAKGLERANEYALQAGQQRAAMEGARRGWSQERTASMVQHYRDVVMDEMRKAFRSQHPEHDFDAADSLGMPMLKGKAMENAAVDAAIDSHPTLSKMQEGGFDSYAAHTQPEEPLPSWQVWLHNINSLVRQGILSNVVWHPLFNLTPLVLNEGVNPLWVARALAIDPRGSFIPKAWIDRAVQYKANAPKFGSALQMDPMRRAKILTSPYKGLTPSEMAMKAVTQASKWNQDVTFGYFEDRLSAVLMHHYETVGKMAPEAAARKVRTVLGDYENLTKAERKAGIMNWHYFYSWMRGQLRYWSSQAVTNPKSIMAPVQGVATANQLQGDQGSVPGGSLSLRSALNAVHYGWGTDAAGNPKYVSLPTPNFRYGTDVMRAGASALTGNPTEATEVATHLATSSMPPMTGIAMRLAKTAILPATQPEPWNDILWDKQAPSPAAMMLQAVGQVGDAYAPPPIRSVADAIASKDPTKLAGVVGPNVYSSPNSGPQSKAANAMMYDLRSLLTVANKQGDRALATQLYDLQSRVQDGDPLAVIEARVKLKTARAELGILRPRRFGPRL